jgi:uncharacterized membrane protein (UPF0127 family)
MSDWQKRLGELPHRRHGDVVVYLAEGLTARTRGLAGLDGLADGVALWIARTRSVHSFGMRFALDLVWLDGEGAVVRVDHDVPRRRNRLCRRARSICETAAGQGDRVAAAIEAAPGAPWSPS